jgi:cellulose synthase/poly-beta-1,6-N-acetylglucosamine synthase-like glycosyltransferase
MEMSWGVQLAGWAGAAAGVALLLLALPVAVFAWQVLTASALGMPRRAMPEATGPVRVGVVIPAHNESRGIRATLDALLPQLKPGDRVLVVADNCSDDTAAVARAAGADVTERFDPVRRGKGYALDHGVRHLAASADGPPDVVVIVDADCLVEPGALQRIAGVAHQRQQPVQAAYLMLAPAGASLKMRIAAFAWIVKDLVRPAGAAHWGMPCQLMGTGMAFPWKVLQGASLATGHIVEDMKLGTDLALAGTPPWFEPQAVVTSEFPTSEQGVATQRARWEHGHLQVLSSPALPLIRRGITRGDLRSLALAVDLVVPPFALLVMLVVLASALAVLAFGIGGPAWPAVLGLVLLSLVTVSVLAAWARFARHVVSLTDMVSAPLYALNKVPLYLRYLAGRQSEWVRTRRKGE